LAHPDNLAWWARGVWANRSLICHIDNNSNIR
jgi:hypothetical protein